MTAQTFVSQVGYPQQVLHVGDETQTWCRVHGPMTPHKFTGNGLICLECHPEKKPEEEKKNENILLR